MSDYQAKTLSQLDQTRPTDAEKGNILGAALRETRALFKQYFQGVLTDAGTLQPINGSLLVPATVATAQIANLAITDALVANVSGTKLLAGTVPVTALTDGSITAAKLAGSITGSLLTAGTIGTTQIANAAITSALIANGAVTNALIGAGAVTDTNIAALALNPTKISGAGTAGNVLVSNGTNWVSVPITGPIGARYPGILLNSAGVLTVELQLGIVNLVEGATSGGAGATLPNGSWSTRVVTVQDDPADWIVSITSGVFTLGPGSYMINVRCPVYSSSGAITFMAALVQNLATSPVYFYGSSEKCNACTTESTVQCYISISANATFQVQSYVTGSTGLGGFPSSISGVPERYTQVQIIKQA